jgi:hypothetical protein
MINYNDGKWHGWNGGECPVHPQSVVEAIWDDGSGAGYIAEADQLGWGTSETPPCVFRVVKPYTDPREGYAVTLFRTAREAKTAHPCCDPVFVREVRE